MLSWSLVWKHGAGRAQLTIIGAWLLSVLASIGLGLASVVGHWSGLPVSFGGVELYITLYPPLVICLIWTLCCGWLWGAIPAYLTTLTLALYAGMPAGWAAVFSCADPLGLAVIAIGYQAIAFRRDFRDLAAALFYVQLAFVASIFGSAGALIWCYTNRIDSTAMLAIWQGWWLGSFLQSVLIVGPLMALCWPGLERWLERNGPLLSVNAALSRRSVLSLLSVVTSGVLIYGFISLYLADQQLHAVASHALAPLAHASGVLLQTTWVVYCVFVFIMLFIAFFGYQLFSQWQASTDLLMAELHRANHGLNQIAHTDALSGLKNRRASEEHLGVEWRRALRHGHSATLVMIDIDHFKEINDRYGHPVGDRVIRCLADAIRADSRDIDISGRYGGDEFMVILPQIDLSGARVFAERLRERVAASTVPCCDGVLRFSISLGIAAIPQFEPTGQGHAEWLAQADAALYQAKRAGRNATVLATASGSREPGE
jgi:diguanylate cyclase (GGDEF)-like protein